MARIRLDQLLVERGLAPSRERAKSIILSGTVDVNGQQVDKPGTPVPQNATVEIRGPDHPYVSRGGVKLSAALKAFEIDVQDRATLDVGASTGGFTDCLLQHGAKTVFAVDVGYNQLAYKLRSDPRVVVLERENIRHLEPNVITEPVDLAVIDVSFISLALVLPKVVEIVESPSDIVALVKPQFEAGRHHVPRGGVIKDDTIRRATVDKVIDTGIELGLTYVAQVESPIHGAKGNVEFLVHFEKP